MSFRHGCLKHVGFCVQFSCERDAGNQGQPQANICHVDIERREASLLLRSEVDVMTCQRNAIAQGAFAVPQERF